MKTVLMKGNFAGVSCLLLVVMSVISLSSCSKTGDHTGQGDFQLTYGDSILYLQNQPGDYIVRPVDQKTGQYFGFPEGIEIDEFTGAINVSKSESGLRYRIAYVSPDGDSSFTTLIISGINFPDKFHHLSESDSMALPIYNANTDRALPLSGSNFDEGNNANSGGCSVKTVDGQINLAQTVRNGVFGAVPQNDAHSEFDIYYRLNDNSNKALNKIRVKVYYYNSMSDVPADLLQTLEDRKNDGVFLKSSNNPAINSSIARVGATLKAAKPRPPCIIIIAN